jgi:hypothetical protein
MNITNDLVLDSERKELGLLFLHAISKRNESMRRIAWAFEGK